MPLSKHNKSIIPGNGVCVYVYVYMCVYVCICVCVCVCVCMYVIPESEHVVLDDEVGGSIIIAYRPFGSIIAEK